MRVGRRFAFGLSAVAALTFVSIGTFAQGFDDPRNTSDAYFDAVNQASCYGHHITEGFQAMGIGFGAKYSQLPIGELVNLTIRIRHNSDMSQELQDMAVTVNVSQAPDVQIIAGNFTPNLEIQEPRPVTAGQPYTEPVEVAAGAQEMYVSAQTATTPLGAEIGLGGQLGLSVLTASGERENGAGSPESKSLRFSKADLDGYGAGEYKVDLTWTSRFEQEMTVNLAIHVNYTSSTTTEFTFRASPDDVVRDGDPPVEITVPIMMIGPREGIIDFRVESVSFWEHSAGDAAPRNDGLFYRFMTMKVRGGEDLVQVADSGGVAPIATGVSVDLANQFTRIIGFISAFLVPIAMVTGGMFGKGTRRWMNRMTGGAKKRVLWHSAMSFIIIGIASIHFVLALFEAKFDWTRGLFWGGVGWALLISLGFTGYYQVRMIKRWNYKVWRHTHLWSAVGVLTFALMHTFLEGSDLGAVRDWAGPWTEKLIWPR